MEKLVIDNYEFTLVGDTEYEGKLNIWDRETLVFVDDFEEI